MMFRKMAHGWFRTGNVPYNDFIKALLLNDVDAMNDFINEIALETLSSFDIAKSAAKTNMLKRQQYRIRSAMAAFSSAMAEAWLWRRVFSATASQLPEFGQRSPKLLPLHHFNA